MRSPSSRIRLGLRACALGLTACALAAACGDESGGIGAGPQASSDGGDAGDASLSEGWPEASPLDAGACEPYEPGDDPFAPHLVGWWALDADTQDQSSHGHHCSAVGQAKLVQDPERGGVVELDGDGDYLDCGNGAALDPTQALTIAFWVRVRSFHAEWQSFVSRNGEDCGWNLRRDEAGAGADFALRGTSATDDLRGSRALDDGGWHHVAGVYDGVRRTLYVDGEIDASWEDTGEILACPADHVLIGAMGAESFGYGHLGHDGWLDEVRLYDAALDSQAVWILAGKGRGAHDPEPSNGGPCVENGAVLRWQPGTGSCRHHVYLGNVESEVAAASDPTVEPGRGVVEELEYDPGSLEHHTTYYWRVDEESADGVTRGEVWSFRVCGEMEGGFVLVQAGTFTMGASQGDGQACRTNCYWPFDIEKPHVVNISRDFWMKATEVTHGEWIAAFGSTPGVFSACGDDCPVENVTWWQMLAYCNQRSLQEGRTPCYFTDAAGTTAYDMTSANARQAPQWVAGLACTGYRLPTEAEWEYAARAGTTTPVFLGEATDANVSQIAWYGKNSQCSYSACEDDNCRSGAGNIPPSGPQPAGQKTANAWGLYDTSGNVWEFVWDVFGEYHDGPVDDPTGPVTPSAGFHVARGGSWLNGTAEARVSARDGDDSTCDPDNGPGSHTGFRIARTAP